MTYAEIKAQHIAGKPPGTDPQRAGEPYPKYVERMAACGFAPDINDGESDADYLIRVAASKPTPYPTTVIVSAGNVIGMVASALSSISSISSSYALTSSYSNTTA